MAKIESCQCWNNSSETQGKVDLPEPVLLQSTALKKAPESPTQPNRFSRSVDENGYSIGASEQDNYGPSCDNSPQVSPEDGNVPHVPIHSLYALTKLRALRSPDAPDGHTNPGQDYCVARGIVQREDAEHRLDAFMYGVGCKYQELDELRRKSPVLTAATLTVAALHDPGANSLYGICSSEFRRLAERSMFDRRVNRDYLRAMCLNRAIEEKSEYAADDARLWYILNICDQHLATLYGRPAIVQEDSSMQQWESFLGSTMSTEEDKRLASQVALLGIIGSIREGQPTPRAYIHQIAHFNKQLDQWINHWSDALPEQYQHIGRFPRKGVLLHFHFAKLHLYYHVFRGLSGENPIPHHFLDCAATAISVATSTIDFILTDSDVAAGIVGIPSYLHYMTAFACMFLIKVAVKYGRDLIEPDHVWNLTTNLVRHFRSLPAGRWHLANLMAPGLERMAATLKPGQLFKSGHTSRHPQTMDGAMHPNADGLINLGPAGSGMDEALIGMEGELFFDCDMSFGLSPIFQFDMSSLNTDN
ncbi:hypothetical protein LZ30DRAFT_752668 [Colletotrichum cereale]|nr:hypothetical protein LZ30DRAFT_752668 [Colletotrichum cereale]